MTFHNKETTPYFSDMECIDDLFCSYKMIVQKCKNVPKCTLQNV